jgi:putative transposase
VFAVKFRKAVILPEWKDRLYMYMTGILQNHVHKMISINGMEDHVHMFFGMRPVQSLSDLVRIVKGESSEWINKQQLTPFIFRWQEGFGAFSYSKNQIPVVARYIQNQEEHHKEVDFLREYEAMLKNFDVEY